MGKKISALKQQRGLRMLSHLVSAYDWLVVVQKDRKAAISPVFSVDLKETRAPVLLIQRVLTSVPRPFFPMQYRTLNTKTLFETEWVHTTYIDAAYEKMNEYILVKCYLDAQPSIHRMNCSPYFMSEYLLIKRFTDSQGMGLSINLMSAPPLLKLH